MMHMCVRRSASFCTLYVELLLGNAPLYVCTDKGLDCAPFKFLDYLHETSEKPLAIVRASLPKRCQEGRLMYLSQPLPESLFHEHVA